MSNMLLHEENLLQLPLTGEYLRDQFAQRVGEVAIATKGVSDPSVSVVIRSRNNVNQLVGLLDDIATQQHDGEVEVILVDTESTDGTPQEAKRFGAEVVRISQEDFNYPKALNLGFMAASNEWVFSFVDHSQLAHDHTFRIATRASSTTDVAAVSGITFPKGNTTWTERVGGALFFPPIVRKQAKLAKHGKTPMGFLATNASVINREAWSEAGGFDESYGAGGEDGAMARSIFEAGHQIMSDPAMAVYHSHGVGPIQAMKQGLYWASLGKPAQFDRSRLESYRPDLR